MSITNDEALASLRLLTAIAKADGVLAPEEQDALASAAGQMTLPAGVTVSSLLEEKHDVGAILAELKSPEAKRHAYESAYSMARADGTIDPSEAAILEQARKALNVDPKSVGFLDRVFSETKDTFLLSNIQPIADATAREKEIKEDIVKYATMTAVLGLFPVPGVAIATDLVAVGLQTKLVRDIGQYFGHKMDDAALKALMVALGGSTTMRIAVNNLAKFIPGFGSGFAAATNFASTYAFGKVGEAYFASGQKLEPKLLKEGFKNALDDGKKLFGMHKKDVEKKKSDTEAKIQALQADLEAGKLTQAEYQKKVAELA